ncbi:MAG: HipA domain-containing protein [Ruthenibacterium sp.]
MIDFTNSPLRNKAYAGANGSKISVLYNDELYMLKFPSVSKINKELSYTDGCISEYIGCHIFESIGIPVQETLLGTYLNGKEKVVVACKDFTKHGLVFQDFASLKNTIIDSEHNGYGTELDDVLNTIEKQRAIDPIILRERFWDVFIVDALIGNWDRHNGNWGFLYDSSTDETTLAPVFDCGSCLFPNAGADIMQRTINEAKERDARVFSIPLSALKVDNHKINYFDFISSLKNKDCNKALKRIVPKISLVKINSIIDGTPYITDLQKEFYKTMITERKERILDFSLSRLIAREKEHQQQR